MILARLRDLIARFRAQDVDDELVSLARRQFLQRTGTMLALPIVAPLVAEQLVELLTPSTILLPSTEQVWMVNTLGGFFYSRELSKVLRQTVKPLVSFRQFHDRPRLLPPHARGNFTWDVYGRTP